MEFEDVAGGAGEDVDFVAELAGEVGKAGFAVGDFGGWVVASIFALVGELRELAVRRECDMSRKAGGSVGESVVVLLQHCLV